MVIVKTNYIYNFKMVTTISTKYIGQVRDVFRRECEVKWKLEDGIEDYIKRDMRIRR